MPPRLGDVIGVGSWSWRGGAHGVTNRRNASTLDRVIKPVVKAYALLIAIGFCAAHSGPDPHVCRFQRLMFVDNKAPKTLGVKLRPACSLLPVIDCSQCLLQQPECSQSISSALLPGAIVFDPSLRPAQHST